MTSEGGSDYRAGKPVRLAAAPADLTRIVRELSPAPAPAIET
jgi:hypothetical protein